MPKIAGRDRKAEILDAARDLIFTEGSSRFTIRRLAERVQISEAAVYRHFPSKEELLLGLLEQQFQGWEDGVQKVIATKASPAERLAALARFHLSYLLERQFNPILLLSDATDPGQSSLRNTLQHIASALGLAIRQLVRAGIADRSFGAGLDPDIATATVLGAVQSTVLQWTLNQDAEGMQTKLMRSVTFLIRCFKNPPAAHSTKKNESRKGSKE